MKTPSNVPFLQVEGAKRVKVSPGWISQGVEGIFLMAVGEAMITTPVGEAVADTPGVAREGMAGGQTPWGISAISIREESADKA